MTMNEEQ
jgi:hypothetical protein